MSQYWQTLPYLFWYSTSLDATASGFTSRHFLVFCLHMLAKLCSSLIYNLCPLLAGLEHCQSDFAKKKKKKKYPNCGSRGPRMEVGADPKENKPIILQVIYGACAIFRSSAWSLGKRLLLFQTKKCGSFCCHTGFRGIWEFRYSRWFNPRYVHAKPQGSHFLPRRALSLLWNTRLSKKCNLL